MNLPEFLQMSEAVLQLLGPAPPDEAKALILDRLLKTNRIVMPTEAAAHREHLAHQERALDTVRVSAMAAAGSRSDRSDF